MLSKSTGSGRSVKWGKWRMQASYKVKARIGIVGIERFQERADVHYEKLAGLVWTGLTSRCQDFSRGRLALS